MIKMEKEFSPTFTRRIDLLDKLIDTYLPDSYPCDYVDQWNYVRNVAEEFFYILQDDDFLNTGSGFSRNNPKWVELYEENKSRWSRDRKYSYSKWGEI